MTSLIDFLQYARHHVYEVFYTFRKETRIMKTWADYKNHVKEIDSDTAKELAEIEENAKIISAMIQHSYAQAIAKQGRAMDDVFDDLERSLK